MNVNRRNLVTTFFLCVFSINILAMLIPIQDEGFLDSNGFISELLKGFGLDGKRNETYHVIPLLLSSNTTDSDKMDYPGIRAAIQSEYSVPGWPDIRWNLRKNITIDYTKVIGSGILTNFPVLIDLYDTDLQKDAQINGNDIMFTDITGSILDYEKELYERVYNSTHAHLVAWVEVNLSNSQDTTISMYYGNPTAVNQENPTGVWDSYYLGVWHLAETTSGVGAIKDSSSNNIDGTDSGNPTLGVIGQIGNCIDFDGIDDYVNVIDNPNLDITDEITLEAWVKDPSVVYYFNGYDSSEAWPFDPQNTVDGDDQSRAHTNWINSTNNETHLFNSNTAPETELGTITKVEIRGNIDVYGSGKFYITPVFSSGNGSTRLFQNTYTDWTSWIDITSDPNAPNPWIWSDVKNLNVRVMASDPPSHDNSLYKMEIRLTYQKTIVTKGRDAYALTVSESGSPLYGFVNNTEITANVLTPTDWHLYAMTYDNLNQILYIDGSQVNSTLLSGSIPTNTNNLTIGNGFTGKIDELRISNIARTSDWIETEYNNQNDPKSFFSIGTKQPYRKYDWPFPMLDFRKSITINPNKVSSDLTNFPVLLNLSDSDLHDTDKVQADGDDILFTDVSGNKIDHEIELFDQTGNGTHAHLVAWVKVPSLSSSIDTTIIMYYGNKDLSCQANPEGIWDSDYMAVWHLSESGDGSQGEFKDSTLNNNNGQGGGGIGSNVPSQTTGLIGKGQNFDGSNDDIQVPDSSSLSSITNSLTVGGWIYSIDNSPSGSTAFKGPNTGSDYEYGLTFESSDIWIYTRGTSGTTNWHTNEVGASGWHYYVYTYDGNIRRLYIDGVEQESSSVSGNINTGNDNIYLGWNPWTYSTDGIVDEVRIVKAVRSAEWLLTEYNNQLDPDGFYSLDLEEHSPIDDDWAFPDFKFRKAITIESSKVNTDLINFPVLLNITDADLHDNGKVQADGNDILFTDSLGTKLDHEIEVFNQTGNGTHAHLVAWVRVPNLLSTYNTNITMYYGNSVVGSQEYHEGVWDSNYVGVWHMNQDPPLIEDSTSINIDGTTYGSMTSANQITGKIGGSLDFDATDDYVDCGDPTELQITGAMTVETWLYADFVGNDYLVGKNGPSNQRGWDLSFDDDPGIEPDGWIMFRLAIGANSHRPIGYERINASQWYHVVGVYNPSTYLRFYLNGQLVAEDTTSIPSTQYVGSNPFRFGTRADNPCYYNGTLDEVRISNVARSLDWIETEYSNQFDPDSFYSVGSEEIHESDHWAFSELRYRKIITIDANKVNGSGSLTNFPVLLNITDADLHDSSKVQADGDDILFTDCLGTKLDHEIEFFNQTGNGTHAHLVAWVRIPILLATTDTNITMYYGNNAVRSQENPQSVWDENYVSIWHLSESSGSTKDSTTNGIDGTSQGGVTQGALGQLGEGYYFDGSDGYINLGTNVYLYGVTPYVTVSAWIYPSSATQIDDARIMETPHYTLYNVDTGSNMRFLAENDSTYAYSRTPYNTEEWIYFVGVFDGSETKIYENGILLDSDPLIGSLSTSSGVSSIGGRSSGNWWSGNIDEVRISSIVRSTDWISTEYNNQYDPDSFCSISSEEINCNWWADSSFKKRKDIVIAKEKVSADLTNFPILVDIYDSDLRTDVQADAADLLFTERLGTKLDHEIELFDQTGNGTHAHLVAWVKIPVLNNDSDTIISMYYGNNELESQENSEGVWMGYGGVWHLSEDPTGVAPQFKDSTLNDNNGTAMNLASENQVTGKIDGSLTFDDSNERCVEIPHDSSLQFSSPMTISAWVKTTDSDSDVGLIINKWGSAVANRNYWLGKLDGSNIAFFVDDTQNVQASLSFINDNNWHYVVGVADSSNSLLRIYIDGIQRNTASYDGSSVMGTEELAIGHGSGEIQQEWNGWIDECRVQGTIHSASWIVTEYNNQFNSTSFYTVGSEVIFDETPPEILDFGVDDPGTGNGKFWVEITDDSEIASVEVTINNTKYSMNYWNETNWYYDYFVESFQGYYEYLITNASDTMGNYQATNSSLKYHTFDKDLVDPNVLDWEYYDTIGPYGTFKANLTDSWGEIDTVQVNVTTYNMQAFMGQYTTFGSTVFAYMNDTLEMANGLMDFQIIVNDTAGNEFVSTTHQGDVFSNHPPIVENLTLSPAIPWSNVSLSLTYDYYDEDGHGEAGTEIRWYKKNNSVFLLEPTYNDTAVIPASALEVGDQWYVNVTPKDGGLFGETNMSAIITILNTPPSVSAVVVFYSGADPYTTSTLNIDYTYDDHEGDVEDTNNRMVEWYRNSVHNSTLDNSTSVSTGNTTKGETWYYRIRVHDGTGYSSWVSSDTILIQNSIPQAVNLTLPSNPTTMDDLVADWDMVDADGDIEDLNSVIIYWYKDGENQSAWTNLTIIGEGNTSKGESWRFEIQVYDGENYSSLIPLNPPVVIFNSAPTVSNVEINITTPVTTDGLTASWNYSDADNDPEGAPLIKWYLDNVYQPTHDGETLLPASATTKGDNWHFSIQVFDGTAYSAEVNSSQVLIQNTDPELDNLALTADPTTIDDLVASWDANDNDTSDSLEFNVTWYLNGEVNCSWLTSINSATLNAENTTKGDNWSFTVQAYDGAAYSNVISLGYNRTILNTPPVVANLTLTSSPTTTDPLLAAFDYSDVDLADNASLIFNITWYRNGQEQIDLANSTSIGSGNTNKSQFWWFTVQAYDGENFSLKLESLHVQILNTAPDIDNLVIFDPSPTTITDLVASWDDVDADNDTLTYTIHWYIVGVGLQSAYNDLTIVPASATAKGQTWYYNLTAFDGDAYSLEKSSSQVIIQNSPPEIDTLDVTTNPTTTDDLIASWSVTDNDTGDSLTFNVTWYLNGEVNCSWLTSINSATLNAGNTTKDQTWNVTVQAYDGDAYSSILSLVTNITILNSKPIVENPSFNNTSPDVGDDFHINYTGTSTGIITPAFKIRPQFMGQILVLLKCGIILSGCLMERITVTMSPQHRGSTLVVEVQTLPPWQSI
ncbi:MAG: DUF2341 domain-containing protein [Candidatus Hodarchaeales archaeon]|jgi:hypothetical protein